MCRIMINSASRDLVFDFRTRNEKLQRIQTLSTEIENNERGIADKERKIAEIDKKIETAEKIIVAHEQVIKDTEALISNNEKIMKVCEGLISYYKQLLANNESKNNSSIVDIYNKTDTEQKVISTPYQKEKQDLIDLNLSLKNKKQLTKLVEKSPVITDQSVDDSKSRRTAYNILNDCFNKFRLNYLFSMRWL